LFSDLKEYNDPLSEMQEDFIQMYDIGDFNALQTNFLMYDLDKRLKLWKKSSVKEKYQMWVVMDFEHLLQIRNSLSHNRELLDDFCSYYRLMMKEANNQMNKEKLKEKKQLERWGI
jgi:hypothetical protein